MNLNLAKINSKKKIKKKIKIIIENNIIIERFCNNQIKDGKYKLRWKQ